MQTLQKITDEIIQLLRSADITAEKNQLEKPPQPELGDIAFPCFLLAKEQRKSPHELAQEIASSISIDENAFIVSVSAHGPYINFTWNTHKIAQDVQKYISQKGDQWGTSNIQNKNIQLEYSQPNTHKAFHIGHLRNAVLGYALVQLWKSQGNNVQSATYVNDVGSHVAKCLWALKTFYDEADIPETQKGRFLGSVYTRAQQELEDHPEAKQVVQEILQKLEQGDKEMIELWNKTRQWSIDGFDEIYQKLNINFEKTYYESDVKDQGHKIVDQLLEKNLAKESDGAVIMDLQPYDLDVLVIRKSDGTGLYATSDLGLAYAKTHEKNDVFTVLTDCRQALYFKQLFKTLELNGDKHQFEHFGYEMVRLTSGTMSSRKGSVILFEDLYDDVVARATKETQERHSDWPKDRIDQTAQAIALSAIKFSMLKVKPMQIITFDPEEALSFSGFSAPYILYTLARINSILEKHTITPENTNYNFEHPTEKQLITFLVEFEQTVTQSAQESDPSLICKFLHDLAREFSSFYDQCSIQSAEPDVAQARLQLISHVKLTVEQALNLLGIPPIKKM